MESKGGGIKITAVAVTVPASGENLTSIPLWSRTELARIIQSTGIVELKKTQTLTTADLCQNAAERVLKAASLSPKDIDSIIFVSQTPDHLIPPTSVLLQHRLGLSSDITAFDINYGCSGYVYGLFQASLLIQSQFANRVLVCVGDTITRVISPRDRSLRMVLGDAGSCTLVERGTAASHFSFFTDGSRADSLMVPAGGFRLPRSETTLRENEDRNGNWQSAENLHMNGMEILSFALHEVPPIVLRLLDLAGWQKEAVDFFAFHQANRLIVQSLAKKMEIPEEKAPFLLGHFGNSGAATIPLALSLHFESTNKIGTLRDRVLLCGFGSGLSVAGITTSLTDTVFLPVSELQERERICANQ